MGSACEDNILPAELQGRFMVRQLGAICKGGFSFASGYPHSAVGITHKLNLDWLQAAAGVLKTLKGPWVLGADFNCTPEQLQATGWLKLVGGKIVAPILATNGTRTIDFFVVSLNLVDAVAGIVVVEDALCKPHSPVRLYLRAEARTMTVRCLKNVETLGANLPFGPLPKPVREPIDRDKASEHELFDYFLRHV